MDVTWDREADAVYVYLSDAPVVYTHIIDDQRFVHYDELGNIRGVEFLFVSAGVVLSDMSIPTQELANALIARRVLVRDAVEIVPPQGFLLPAAVAYHPTLGVVDIIEKE